MDGYLSNPISFLVSILFQGYALVVLLRLFLQLTRASFYNPVSQFIVKLTSPVLTPMRRVIPPIGKLDTASLLLAWLVKALELLLIIGLKGGGFAPGLALLTAIPGLVELTLNIFLYAIIIQAILSWIPAGGYNPAADLLDSLTAPVLRPVRRHMPLIGGLDLSPMVAIVGLILLKMLLLPPLYALVAHILA